MFMWVCAMCTYTVRCIQSRCTRCTRVHDVGGNDAFDANSAPWLSCQHHMDLTHLVTLSTWAGLYMLTVLVHLGRTLHMAGL